MELLLLIITLTGILTVIMFVVIVVALIRAAFTTRVEFYPPSEGEQARARALEDKRRSFQEGSGVSDGS